MRASVMKFRGLVCAIKSTGRACKLGFAFDVATVLSLRSGVLSCAIAARGSK
jgi:hypothetical protein